MRFAVNLAIVFVLSASAWAADPFLGTWKLNKAKSQMGSSDFQARLFIITGTETGHHIVQRETMPDGTTREVERNEILDGKEHSAQEDTVIVAKRVDSRTKTFTWMKGGKQIRTATDTVSADDRTLTHNVTDLVRNENRIWVFER
ncbi:MAG TPA: hypothetical protein VK752_31565 [Bryobacteraceae bacterium]|jgi:hypothetical protein|nr:hypothetical protein [Bryobacteraceae bacterium]